jgi:murein L,D-transpeptidase YcbB/YkuD
MRTAMRPAGQRAAQDQFRRTAPRATGEDEHARSVPRRRSQVSRGGVALVVALGVATAITAAWLILSTSDDTRPRDTVRSPSGADASDRSAPAATSEASGGALPAPHEDRLVLGYGSTGDAVSALQERLLALGFDPGPIDGQFGARTAAAVTAFQSTNGISADGVVGPETWPVLDGAP